MNKRIANVILLAPRGGVVLFGRNTIRWESHISYVRLLPHQRGIKTVRVVVFIDDVKVGDYDIKWLREYAKA